MKMKKQIAGWLAACILLASPLFCLSADDADGWDYDPETANGVPAYEYDLEYYSKFQGQGVRICVYNWGEYIADGSDGSMDVIREFEELTGIEVDYTTFDTNEGLYSKLQSGSASYDVIIPSDYMVSRMIEKDMLEKLDYSNIPNYERYVDETLREDISYDPTGEYSVPYTTGTVGLIYNTKYVTEPVDSWSVLWDEQYAGKILMFSNSRDAFAIALERLGYSINTESEEEIREAAELLRAQKPLVQAYVMDQIFDKMVEENAWLAPYYAGDYLTMAEDNENLAFVFPSDGFNFFVDAMCIPKGCQNKEAAEMFINFMCEPTVSAENCGTIGYSTPIPAARALLDPEMANSEIAYPSAETLANTESFSNLSDESNKLIDDLWIVICVTELSTGFWIFIAVLVVVILAVCFVNMARKRKRMAARRR